MKIRALRFVRCAILSAAALRAHAECVSFTEAHQHIGKTQCVRGTVFNVKDGNRGVTFLDFCENFDTCPFSVVVFAGDLRHVGDVRRLKGRAIEVNGTVVEYDGRAEIVLRHPRQLGKDAALVPPLPKDYDVERHGKYSPGKLRPPKKHSKNTRSARGRGVDIEDPEDQ